MRPKRFIDATKDFTFAVTTEIVEEAKRLGLNGRQSIVLAIMRTGPGKNAPAIKVGNSGFATLTDKGVIEIGGRPSW